ncbi:MAG: hypothetical protein IT506_07585, partial [Aquabacterium sp.]|nr:hypothetical protein [Aquabacterium sp.]
SGCGQMPDAAAPRPAQTDQHIQLITTLRQPLVSDDMPAWLEAWAKLDATVLKDALAQLDAGEPIALTLCGERHAQTRRPAEVRTWADQLKQTAKRLLPKTKPDLPALLKDL